LLLSGFLILKSKSRNWTKNKKVTATQPLICNKPTRIHEVYSTVHSCKKKLILLCWWEGNYSAWT
jgi:hypothetical protein